jgi:VanZ family protein
VIFGFTSSSFFSGNNTLLLLSNFLNLDYNTSETLNSFIRKGAHVIIFGTLAISLFLMLKKKLLAWGLTTICAIGDEYHQSLVPNRTASIFDVFLDSFAAFVFLLIFSNWFRYRKQQ